MGNSYLRSLWTLDANVDRPHPLRFQKKWGLVPAMLRLHVANVVACFKHKLKPSPSAQHPLLRALPIRQDSGHHFFSGHYFGYSAPSLPWSPPELPSRFQAQGRRSLIPTWCLRVVDRSRTRRQRQHGLSLAAAVPRWGVRPGQSGGGGATLLPVEVIDAPIELSPSAPLPQEPIPRSL